MQDDLERDRIRRDERRTPLNLAGVDGARAFVGRVTSLSPSTDHFIGVIPVAITGAETEGGASTQTDQGSTPIYADLLGSNMPMLGDLVVVRFTDYRWACRCKSVSSSDTTVSLPGCSCSSTPTSLTMTISGTADAAFQPCTFVYISDSTSLASLGATTPGFYSAESFYDSASGLYFRYHFSCDTLFFRLTQVFLDPSGPFEDSPLYSWSMGSGGNTCHPFLATSGTHVTGYTGTATPIVSQ